ncbi:MAG: glucose-6-phosphate isomerase [Hyphomonadaceae bacterium]|nr:glucose-6-phosphate isomerase [Hyphomonadaceae bacterium]MBC6412862.1 glucose-6-phosphate isomerase [Hyphomonadaceae bacterium]
MTHFRDRFSELETLATQGVVIADLFKIEPGRMDNFLMHEGPLRADFSKQAISQQGKDALINLARDRRLGDWRSRFFAGEKINISEDRAVLHPALRGVGGSEGVQKQVTEMRTHLRRFARKIRRDKTCKSVVHIGIGGSDLGPRLVADALAASTTCEYDLRFAENVDGASINDALDGLEPESTLVVVVSKSFTTQETRMNANAARDWLRKDLGEKAANNFIAVSANREGAIEFGIAEDQIFDFWDWVGGRYSVWSAVGLSLQIAFGPDAFDEFLAGAAAMDTHFRDAPFESNIPVMMALAGVWNRNILGYTSLAIIPYSRRLRKLPAFLQQLEMESNGKRMDRDGTATDLTCPVIWGDEGTNGQHAFFQWLHQGTPGAPVDFVAVLEDHEKRPDHHAALLANCFAQSEALMLGKPEHKVREELEARGHNVDFISRIAPQKTFPGNRPSTTITLDELSPSALGHLIALYEHKVFVQGVIWNVNSFDQWGVELGKVLAKTILKDFGGEVSDHDPSTLLLIEMVKQEY